MGDYDCDGENFMELGLEYGVKLLTEVFEFYLCLIFLAATQSSIPFAQISLMMNLSIIMLKCKLFFAFSLISMGLKRTDALIYS